MPAPFMVTGMSGPSCGATAFATRCAIVNEELAAGLTKVQAGTPYLGPESDKIKVMKLVSIQDLKAKLSAMVAQAESGDTIIITRHNAPVAQLSPARTASVQRGKNVGGGRIRAALKRGTKGRYLEVLLEDRGNR